MAIEMSNYRICEEWGEKFVVHSRDLGEKVGGIYPGAKWSDVVANNVYLDDTLYWENEIDYLRFKREILSNIGGEKITVNGKKMDESIRESGSTAFPEKGTGESKNQNALGKSDQDTLHRKWSVKNYKGSHSDKETGKNKNYFRKKKIPQRNNKNYPTKPNIKGDEKVVKVSEKQNYFNWEINHAGVESMIEEEKVASEKYDQQEPYSAGDLYVYE